MKKMKRIVLSTLAACTIVVSTAIPAVAANRYTADAPKAQVISIESFRKCLTNITGCRQWLNQLLQNWFAPGQPDTDVPDVPETPDAPTEKPETPPVTPEEKPETPPVIPEDEPENNAPSSVHAYEKRVVELVNVERAKYGLSPLALSEDLCVKARIKSQDMAENNYFSHTSPTYGSPFDMMKALGITYRSAGENIAMGYSTPEAVVTAWMNSQGHRENILSTKYTTLGVGYVANGGYWTQWFIG